MCLCLCSRLRHSPKPNTCINVSKSFTKYKTFIDFLSASRTPTLTCLIFYTTFICVLFVLFFFFSFCRTDLSRNRFCELPEDVTGYPFLETLIMYNNTMRTIPDTIRGLYSLTFLDLRYVFGECASTHFFYWYECGAACVYVYSYVCGSCVHPMFVQCENYAQGERLISAVRSLIVRTRAAAHDAACISY